MEIPALTQISVMPAKAGIQGNCSNLTAFWIPAFAGMTE